MSTKGVKAVVVDDGNEAEVPVVKIPWEPIPAVWAKTIRPFVPPEDLADDCDETLGRCFEKSPRLFFDQQKTPQSDL